MSDCCTDKTADLERLRASQASVLWTVLAINGVMFLVEFVGGLLAGSVALVSDSLDMLGDTLVYAFSLSAVARGAAAKARAALLKGGIMALFAVAAFVQVARQLLSDHVPPVEALGGIGLLALAANTVCFLLLWRRRGDDVNMSSVWLCSRNDLFANAGVLVAAGGVWLTGRAWPDLLVGLAIALLFARSALTVMSEARGELRRAAA